MSGSSLLCGCLGQPVGFSDSSGLSFGFGDSSGLLCFSESRRFRCLRRFYRCGNTCSLQSAGSFSSCKHPCGFCPARCFNGFSNSQGFSFFGGSRYACRFCLRSDMSRFSSFRFFCDTCCLCPFGSLCLCRYPLSFGNAGGFCYFGKARSFCCDHGLGNGFVLCRCGGRSGSCFGSVGKIVR